MPDSPKETHAWRTWVIAWSECPHAAGEHVSTRTLSSIAPAQTTHCPFLLIVDRYWESRLNGQIQWRLNNRQDDRAVFYASGWVHHGYCFCGCGLFSCPMPHGQPHAANLGIKELVKMIREGRGETMGPDECLENGLPHPLYDLQAFEHRDFGKVQDEGKDRCRHDYSCHHQQGQASHGDSAGRQC